MGDLSIYVRSMFVSDNVLQGIFSTISAAISVVDQDERSLATYPRIILEEEEGTQHETGDDCAAKFFEGLFRIEIVTRQSDTCPAPLAVLNQIMYRCSDLIIGNPANKVALPGIKGVALTVQPAPGQQPTPARWRVDRIWQTSPTRRLPVDDPTFKRHLTTYGVVLNRIA